MATYGQIAELAGRPGQPRLVGYAMRACPEGGGIPWHRVINARGMVSTRSSFNEAEQAWQRALLEREGVGFDSWGRVDLAEFRWKPRRSHGSRRQENQPMRMRDAKI